MEASNRKQPVAGKERIFEELQDLISDQLKAISYKWLSRHFSVSANDAKRLLFEFAEKHRSKVASTYLVAGWTKGANPDHVVQLVDAAAVADRRSKLDPVTSMHVYSIQPSAPKGPSDILNHDELQTKELFLGMVKQGDLNCLSDNRWSAVQCQRAKRDSSLASRKPIPAPPAEEKPVSVVAKAIKDAAAGKPVAAAAALEKEDREPEAKSASAPARAAEAMPPAKPAAAKGKGSAIASMWSKAPAKKAKKAAPQQAAAQPSVKQKAGAVDAEAFMRLNQQEAASSSGEEDEEDIPIRRSQPPRKNALADSDDEAEEPPAQKPAAPAAKPKAASRQPAKHMTVLDEESDSGDEWEAPKQAAGDGRSAKAVPAAADAAVHVTASKPATARAAAEAEEAVEEEEEAAPKAKQGRKPRKASAGAKRPAPGAVKLHDSVSGPARKKVQRTTYNEKGEEVTEMVYQDAEPEPAAPPADVKVAEPAPEEKPMQDAKETVAATSRSNNSGGVKRKAGGGVDSKAAKKPAGKGKAGLGAGQRNIASFFAKR